MDPEKAEQLNCSKCSPQLRSLRNCTGKGTPAKIPLNGTIYTRCPMAISLEQFNSRFLVNLYFDCKERGLYPYPGGVFQQTAFCVALFDYLDELVAKHRKRLIKEQKNSVPPKK